MQDKAVKINVSLLEKVFRTIVSIGILVAAFLLAMDTANAEGMADNIRTACYDIMDSHFSNYQQYKTTIDSIMNECPFVTCNQYTIGSNTWYYMDFYNTENWGCMFSTSNSSWYGQLAREGLAFQVNNQYCTAWGVTDQYYEYDKNIKVYHMASKNNQFYFINTPQPTLDVRYSVLQYGHWLVGNIGQNSNISTVAGTYSNEYTNNSVTHISTLLDYGHIYVQTARNYGGFRYIDDTIQPITNNTAGFDCYKLDTKGGIYFVADYSSLITFDHSTTNTSTFSCDVHLDDTIQTITLDSTSEYYLYDVDHREAEYSFPITAFVPDYTDYEHVWIDNVLVVNTYSGHGDSVNSTFAYLTPIDILGSFPEEELTPTIIPQVSPVPDNLEGYGIDYHSGDELKTLYNNNMFNQWITESEFYSDIAQLGGGRSVKLVGATDQNVYENNTDNTLAYLSNVASILSGTADVPGTGAVMTVVYGVNAFFDTINAPRNNGQIDFNGAAEEYIKDNLYSSTYDIIILEAYYDAEALQTNSNDLLYTPIPSIDDLHAGEPYAGKIFYVILTQRYIESLNLDGLGSLQKLLESDVYYAKSTYEYLYDRLNDFEDKSLDGIKDILGIDNQIFDKLGNIDTYIQRIEGLLKKILDAILSLNIQPTDTTAIENKLDDIYTRLGNSNLNSDWYKRYREWLYDETNDNVLNTPHEYMLNTFDDVKALFDVFAYFDLPQTGFWSSAREYLNRMNGNTYNDNINDYLVTGIGSQNFYKDNCNTLVWSDIQ